MEILGSNMMRLDLRVFLEGGWLWNHSDVDPHSISYDYLLMLSRQCFL